MKKSSAAALTALGAVISGIVITENVFLAKIISEAK